MKTQTDYSFKQKTPDFRALYMPKANVFEKAFCDIVAEGADVERPWIQELANDVDIFINPVNDEGKIKTSICIQELVKPIVGDGSLKSWIKIKLQQPKLRFMTRVSHIMDCEPKEYGYMLLTRVLELKQEYQKAKQIPQKIPSPFSIAWLKALFPKPVLVFAAKNP